MISLAIHAAVHDISLCLAKDGQLIYRSWPGPTAKAEDLPLFVQELLSEQKIAIDQLSEIVVAIGYGAFTGLRLSLTVAKTLALENNIPLIIVPTLDAFAAEIIRNKGLRDFRAALYACRGEYNAVDYLEGKRSGEDMIVPEAQLADSKLPLITEKELIPTASGLMYIKDHCQKLTDRQEIIALQPVYSHSARINKSRKEELRHLQAVFDGQS